MKGVDFADADGRGDVLDPGPKHLALGLGNAVDLRYDGDVGQRQHRPDFERKIRPAGGFENDEPQPAVDVGRAAEAEPGRFNQENVAC